jgi:ATP-binding cassette subfamily C (CFTR/MRP) protein 1
MKDSVVFSRLMDEYGNLEQEEDAENKDRKGEKDGASSDTSDVLDEKKANAALMQTEERNTGSVSWETYRKYLGFAGGVMWAPAIVGLLTLTQGAEGQLYFPCRCDRWMSDISYLVGDNLFLGFWTARSIPGFKQGDYMAVYVALGTIGLENSTLTPH